MGATLVPYLIREGFATYSSSRTAGEIRCDLARYSEVEQTIRSIKPDAVINLAALTNVDECESNSRSAYIANALTANNLTKAIRSNTPKAKLIHLSTDQVYDGIGPHCEEDTMPVNVYALTKLLGEKFIVGVNHCILRVNMFGRSQHPLRASFADWVVQSAASNTKRFLFEDVYISPLSINTLSKMINVVLVQGTQGLFNLGSKEGKSKYEIGIRLSSELGYNNHWATPGKVADTKLQARRPNDMRMDVAAFERSTGVALPTLESEIEAVAREFK